MELTQFGQTFVNITISSTVFGYKISNDDLNHRVTHVNVLKFSLSI